VQLPQRGEGRRFRNPRILCALPAAYSGEYLPRFCGPQPAHVCGSHDSARKGRSRCRNRPHVFNNLTRQEITCTLVKKYT